METFMKDSAGFEMQEVQPSEMQAVCGGVGFYPDISGMPDRTVICGTMWILDHIFGRMSGTR